MSNIFEVPKHNQAVDLSNASKIEWHKYQPADSDPWWKYFLTLRNYFPQREEKSFIRVRFKEGHTMRFIFSDEKDTEKVYKDMIKTWKGK